MHSHPRPQIAPFPPVDAAPLRRRAALALAVSALCGTAQAELSDTIHPYVSAVYSYDDNLLRLPDGVSGGLGRGDSITQLQAGLNLERPIGRQKFTADLKVSRVSFKNYDQLNYNGKDFTGEWQWAALRDLSGHIGGSYSETLTPFTDYHSSERNIRTSRRVYADGNWRFAGSWQVHGGFNRYKYQYDLSSQRFNDRTEDVSDVGVDYLAASGSRFGLVARHLKGEYPNHPVLGGVLLDNDYQQDELKANVYWILSGVTQVQMLAGWARRDHNQFVGRDSSGANGRITGIWTPTGKLKFTLAGWREFSAVESNLVNASLSRGASLAAVWQATAKLAADAQLRRETRDFTKVSTVTLPGDASDSGKRASVGLTYTPKPTIQFNLGAFRETRAGSLLAGTNSYKSKGASFSAYAQF
ncbi:XrtB/PEP-CTERM-associated polysaccharide biosynthesis outer membrane protein EpsL [Duganella radicis]|uniref:Outer membrane beta-barrel protein n=1 Tax=Duganella radicis TaxID=551988 RepID=A0A6L6PNI9_9BURK|nr:XrtB/PEP-CTERM-associated polysaccharide biosynthesis outer membrane protein EpsL [Duganella radicis]MTV40533.1 outer membrane beta-barrel protein [Duganella radicis]